MSEKDGISMRFKDKWEIHPDSHVSTLCFCGQSFNYFGPDATAKANDWLKTHECPFRAIPSDAPPTTPHP
jgi:hypothetical protein